MLSVAPESSVASYVLTLRSERPVEGCELTPNAFLQLKGGNLDNSGRAKLMDSKPFRYVFIWHRGPMGSICANNRCPRGHSFDPNHWSKAAIGGPHLACNVCLNAGKEAHEATFCSAVCFKEAWRDHSQLHAQLKFPNLITSDSEPQTPISADDEVPLAGSGTGLPARLPASNYGSSTAPEGWTLISRDKDYLPTAEDVGCRLRVQVSAEALADGELLAGPVSIFTEVVLQAPSAPPPRALLSIPGANATGAAFRFRIISYNILAELYATKQAYPYCDSWSLSWPYRRRIILQELEEMQGDVVCLQEVQADYFEQHISPFMTELGYDGLFKAKSRDCADSYVKVDGCATFWKRDKFINTENYCIEFNDIARQEVARIGLDDAEARKFMNRLSRDNVAQIVVLEALKAPARQPGMPPQPRSAICIVNTHLYSNVQRADVKLWQTVNLVRELRQFVVPRDLPVLLCGDFNSEPESAVYEYLMSGMITSSRPELMHSHGASDNGHVRILPDPHRLSHDLDLTSVMNATLGREPDFTNYTARFKGTLDYIYFTPSRLRVLAIAGIPEEREIRALSGEGLPSAAYPSDHLMLCADVAMMVSGSGSILNTEMGGGRHGGGIPTMMRSHSSASNLSAPHTPHTLSLGSLSRNYNSTSSLTTIGSLSGKLSLSNGAARK